MSARVEIRQTVLDYFEGWFDGDAARMDRALHPDLVKRRAGEELGVTTKPRMVELTEHGRARRKPAACWYECASGATTDAAGVGAA